MVAYTTTYNLKKPTVGDDEDVWGGYLNDSMDLIDDVLDGTTPVTGIDINSGTIGGVTIDGDLSFSDNTKAIFGAGSDLQIYHDGSNSHIAELGTGNLTITGGGPNVSIVTGSSENMAVFANNGAVTLYYDNASKLATTSTGVDITGNITVSGTVDGRDVAADGTKLDGIESGATADQTKADIDALGIAASTAATLATARNIALTGAVTGNVNFDGSGNVSITTTATSDPTLTLSGDVSGSATFTNLGNATLTATVADDSHNHVISNVDGLQTALDGKLSTTGTAANSQLLDSLDSSQFLRSDTSDTFTSISGTSITATGDIYVGDQIIHSGDADTYMQFHAANQWRVVTGGTEMLEVNDSNVIVQSGLTVNGTLSLGSNVINDVEDIHLRDKLFHDGDTDTYLGFGTNTINLVTGNSTSATFNSSGLFLPNGSLAEDYDALSGTSPTCNVDSGGAFSLTMTGNTTFTFSGADSGYSQGFILQLTGNGSTVTWPSSVDWAGGTAPDAPASGETDIYVFWTRDGGTTWYGVQSIDAAA